MSLLILGSSRTPSKCDRCGGAGWCFVDYVRLMGQAAMPRVEECRTCGNPLRFSKPKGAVEK